MRLYERTSNHLSHQAHFVKYGTTILLLLTLMGVCQAEEYPKRAPFTRVRWEGHKPVVKIGEKWFTLDALRCTERHASLPVFGKPDGKTLAPTERSPSVASANDCNKDGTQTPQNEVPQGSGAGALA